MGEEGEGGTAGEIASICQSAAQLPTQSSPPIPQYLALSYAGGTGTSLVVGQLDHTTTYHIYLAISPTQEMWDRDLNWDRTRRQLLGRAAATADIKASSHFPKAKIV